MSVGYVGNRAAGADDAQDFLQRKFTQAFGAPFNVEENPVYVDRSLWWEATSLRGKQNALRDGRVGTRFVRILAEEIERCIGGRQNSERQLLFSALVLHRDNS